MDVREVERGKLRKGGARKDWFLTQKVRRKVVPVLVLVPALVLVLALVLAIVLDPVVVVVPLTNEHYRSMQIE